MHDDKVQGLISRNVMIDGRRTSMRLEPELWAGLQEIADRENRSINHLCTEVWSRIKDDRAFLDGKASFTARVRVFIVEWYRGKVFTPSQLETYKVTPRKKMELQDASSHDAERIINA